MTYYYVCLSIFAILCYLIITDNSIATFTILCSKIFRLWYEKVKWWIMYSPDNPIVRYFMWRRSNKLARELFEELNITKEEK